MPKRFLVFTGDYYYPKGGWADFKESFNDLSKAISFGKGYIHEDSMRWYQVVDLEEAKILEEG